MTLLFFNAAIGSFNLSNWRLVSASHENMFSYNGVLQKEATSFESSLIAVLYDWGSINRQQWANSCKQRNFNPGLNWLTDWEKYYWQCHLTLRWCPVHQWHCRRCFKNLKQSPKKSPLFEAGPNSLLWIMSFGLTTLRLFCKKSMKATLGISLSLPRLLRHWSGWWWSLRRWSLRWQRWSSWNGGWWVSRSSRLIQNPHWWCEFQFGLSKESPLSWHPQIIIATVIHGRLSIADCDLSHVQQVHPIITGFTVGTSSISLTTAPKTPHWIIWFGGRQRNEPASWAHWWGLINPRWNEPVFWGMRFIIGIHTTTLLSIRSARMPFIFAMMMCHLASKLGAGLVKTIELLYDSTFFELLDQSETNWL